MTWPLILLGSLVALAGCTGGPTAADTPPLVTAAPAPATTVNPAPPGTGRAAADCPVTAAEVELTLELPVTQEGCTFTAGFATARIEPIMQEVQASRGEAEQEYDRVVDLDGGSGFFAIGDLSAQAVTTVDGADCSVILDGFEFGPDRFRDVALGLLDSCIT